MVVLWFLLALALLAAALVLLRLDARQRGGGTPRDAGAGRPGPRPGSERGDRGAGSDDDDEVTPPSPSAAPSAAAPAAAPTSSPSVSPSASPSTEVTARMPALRAGSGGPGDSSGTEGPGGVDGPVGSAGSDAPRPAPFQRPAGDARPAPRPDDTAVTSAPQPDDTPAPQPAAAREPRPDDTAAAPAPRLLDRVRALLPARRRSAPRPVAAEPVPVDPLAGSPVVRWLEDREFAPTPTPAPEFLHGDFAGGLSALGTVSHGMFRGRRAIMGVTGGRTVLALRRDTASDVVLDLSRPDVDAEPGFHDAGEVAALEARTSDFGRLDLIDRGRLADAVRDVPGDVRRIWAEGEWVAATIDGVDDPSTWDDVVVALHRAADVLAPFPPVGGRARALPAEIDPGAPGAADGPDADPTTGMDGEVGTGVGTNPVPPLPVPGEVDGADVHAEGPAGSDEGADMGTDTGADSGAEDARPAVPEPRRAGHLRLVPDRTGVRDLSAVPVVADRGDTETTETGTTETGTTDTGTTDTGTAEAEVDTGTADTDTGTADTETADTDTDTDTEPVAPEPDPFAEIMEPSGPVPPRGDVAADFLPPRPPLSRPTRGVGQAFPEDASVPPLAAGAATGGAGIKPLGSEDDEDEIRTEVERFDAARIDGGSDLARVPGGRHGTGPAGGVTGGVTEVGSDVSTDGGAGRLTVADLAAKVGTAPTGGRRHHRRAEPGERTDGTVGAAGDAAGQDDTGSPGPGRERPGVDPDLEQTARLYLPPDIRE